MRDIEIPRAVCPECGRNVSIYESHEGVTEVWRFDAHIHADCATVWCDLGLEPVASVRETDDG